MLLLATLAFAAAPGSYVLVGRDAAFCPAATDKDCQTIEAPKNKSEPWRDARPWRVLAEQGEWLQVEAVSAAAVPGLCLAPAPVAPKLTFSAWVKASWVVKAVGRSVTVAGDNGTSLTLAPGHAINTSGERPQVSGDAVFTRVVVPADAAATSFVPGPLAAPTNGAAATLSHNLTYTLGDNFGTGTLWGRDGWTTVAAEGHTTIANGCQSLTIDDAQLAGAIGPVVAATPKTEDAVTEWLEAGTALSWPTGAAAGTVATRFAMPEGEDKKGKRCYDAWDGAGTLTLCFVKKK